MTFTPKIHNCGTTPEAYAFAITSEDGYGDVLIIGSEEVVGVDDTWPFAVTVKHGALHQADTKMTRSAFLAAAARSASDPETRIARLNAGIDAALLAAKSLGFPVIEFSPEPTPAPAPAAGTNELLACIEALIACADPQRDQDEIRRGRAAIKTATGSVHYMVPKCQQAPAPAIDANEVLAALSGLLKFITSGEHYESKNPYCRPPVKAGLIALARARGLSVFGCDWMDANNKPVAKPAYAVTIEPAARSSNWTFTEDRLADAMDLFVELTGYEHDEVMEGLEERLNVDGEVVCTMSTGSVITLARG